MAWSMWHFPNRKMPRVQIGSEFGIVASAQGHGTRLARDECSRTAFRWPHSPLHADFFIADSMARFSRASAAGEGKSPDAGYDTVTGEDLAALPVAKRGRGDTLLTLGASWLPLSKPRQLLDAWEVMS